MKLRYLSLCSGIEAASVAWQPLGWEPVAFAEIEPFPCAVLAHYYPDVPNLGDITKVADWRPYRGTVNLVVAGTPCQDFSIAGKRAGLAGERSGLAMVFAQILSVVRPEWFVWENVPGVFSTAGGRDFGTFIGTLDDIGYSVAWRVLDAQFFGVPQRRRRVYAVGHLGDWRPAAAVLFEPESLCGDTAPRRKTRTDVAGTLKGGSGRKGWDSSAEGTYIPEIVSQAMSCKWSKGTSGPAGDEYHNLVCAPLTTKPYADNDAQETRLVVSQYGDKAAALTAEGADASPCADRGSTIFAVRTAQTSSNGWGVHEDTSYTLDGANGQAVLAFHGSQDPCVSGDVTNPIGRNQGAVMNMSAVRRLTPTECERLQGFPDGYTAIDYRGKPAPDSPRYRALGNSMAVPVMRWIGERIAMVEARHA